MSDSPRDDLLARLAGASGGGGDDPWSAVEASKPSHVDSAGAPVGDPSSDEAVSKLIDRINQLADGQLADGQLADGEDSVEESFEEESPVASQRRSPMAVTGSTAELEDGDAFMPIEPESLKEAGIAESEVEVLILKFLLACGEATGRVVTDQIGLPFRLINDQLERMKQERMVGHRGSASMNDYVYELTDMSRERARRLSEHCSYFGTAPVTLRSYIESVNKQSLTLQHPTCDDLKRAFSDLLINEKMLLRLGPAINSGRGLFLFGSPGNGKTSIAERLTIAFGQHIWIPKAINIDGEIMRVYDRRHHNPAPLEATEGLIDQRKIDKRWVRIVRPTIVVGGELTLENLEVVKGSNGVSESPVQLKSNCGTLVIDDFGRQRMSTDELLNRWIVPLEKRHDYLNLANGTKIQVPFDQLIVFSTNLEPRDLVDDAFLRRIPYKIEVLDPTEAEFRELFKLMAPKFDLELNEEVLDYLIEEHYKKAKRPFRCCQPRDLLMQIRNFCFYTKSELAMSREFVDMAVENYFAIM